jgi:hypothetical protein
MVLRSRCRWCPLRWRRIRSQINVDRQAVDFVSPVIPDAYPAATIPQFGADDCKMVRHLFGSRARAGLVLEQHSAGIENDVTIEEEIKIETRHMRRPSSRQSQRPTASRRAFESLLRCRGPSVGAPLHQLKCRLGTGSARNRSTAVAASSGVAAPSREQASDAGNWKHSVQSPPSRPGRCAFDAVGDIG